MSDLLDRAQRYLPVPYRLHGQDPTGWDCLGLLRYLRQDLFGLPSPPWATDYTMADALGAPRTSDLFAQHIGPWSAVDWRPGGPPPPAGAALLFRRYGRPAHVGLMLTHRTFIHCEQGCGTAMPDLSPRWEMRILGVYEHPGPYPAVPRAEAL